MLMNLIICKSCNVKIYTSNSLKYSLNLIFLPNPLKSWEKISTISLKYSFNTEILQKTS